MRMNMFFGGSSWAAALGVNGLPPISTYTFSTCPARESPTQRSMRACWSTTSQFPSPALIHSEELHGRAPDNCYADNFSIAQPKVFLPIIRPRMKQAREFAGLRVDAGKICAFVEIAVDDKASARF